MYKKKIEKHKSTWRLKSMLLNNDWVSNEIKKETIRYLKRNENENTMTQDLWDIAKEVLRERFIATKVYINKQEKS